MNDHQAISQRSEGPTPDSLGLKVTGDSPLTLDLRRTQEVEITVRGTVGSHLFEDKRDKHGNVEHTIKWAKVKVDELVDIVVLSVPRRMPGQTAMPVDGVHGEPDEQDDREEIVDAEVVGELEAGDPPPGVDAQTGEVDGDGQEPEEEQRAAPDRHPQIPEPAWSQLNIAQKWAVYEKVERLERLADYLMGDITPTDRTVATDEHTEIHDYLKAEFGIVLIPLEELPPEEQPAGEPPPPVTENDGPLTRQQLIERRKYISSRTGLPLPLAEARDSELAEIDRRLKALGDAA